MSKKKKKPIDVALRYLKVRPRSIFEVKRKLAEKKFSPAEINKTIRRLVKEGLLDDRRFAILWVRHRDSLKPSGQKLLFLELKKLGIAEEVIKEVLARSGDEFEKAAKAAESKMRLYRKLPRKEFYLKMGGFLARRGFNYGVIKKVIDKLTHPPLSNFGGML